VAIEEVSEDQTHKYGIIDGDLIENSENLFQVRNMVEKPNSSDAPSNLAIIGRYILTPDIFDILENTEPGAGGEIQITDALLKQAKKNKVIAFRYRGQRFDCGSIQGYVKATNYFAKLKNII
jgi:UTP--glucose-1-phosphate uridylyltransferase